MACALNEAIFGDNQLNDKAAKVSILGVWVNPIRSDELCRRVIARAKRRARTLVTYVNAHNLNVANRDEHYRELVNTYDLVYPDGFGAVLAARILGYDFPPRSTSADFFEEMFGAFAQEGISVYLLGAEPGVMEESVDSVRRKYPDIKVKGIHHGYFTAEEEPEIIEEINRLEPDVLFVSTGVPHQEKWIERNLSRLRPPVIWASGGVFDFVSGRTRRAPRFVRDHGMEWLYRLIVEPRRLWRRYLLGNPLFLLLVAKYFFKPRGTMPSQR
jgi:N-acetylglucosaminyldiphosphoundecaprenol N-acetyl-beta-D-mannosaminyltransferase